MQRPTAKLISHTAFPVETIYLEWTQSRTDKPLMSASDLSQEMKTNDSLRAEVEDVFQRVISMSMPLMETVELVWQLENIPVALREQIVRHRVGHKFGGQLGADILPDLTDSTFWAQTMRVRDMSNFATNEMFYKPQSVVDNSDLSTQWDIVMGYIQDMYVLMTDKGIPPEDARMLLPMAVTHRMTWKQSLASAIHVLKKRSCWIAELGFWEGLVLDMVQQLSAIHPLFGTLIAPPCIDTKTDKFVGCKFEEEVWGAIRGDYPQPPCPLYGGCQTKDAKQYVEVTLRGKSITPAWTIFGYTGTWDPQSEQAKASIPRAIEQSRIRTKMWGHDPVNWQPLETTDGRN